MHYFEANMTIMNLAVILSVMLWPRKGSAYPHPHSSAAIQPNTGVSNIHLRSTPPISLPLTLLNSSNIPDPPPPNSIVTCLMTGSRKTTVDGCRPTLNQFRTFPDYRLVQPFREGKYPKRPETPPLVVFSKDADCAVEIASRSLYVEDDFSWEQVRATATDIVADCEDKGGWGGWSPIGRGIGFFVRVIGFVEEGSRGNGSVVGGEIVLGNLTESAVGIVDARSFKS